MAYIQERGSTHVYKVNKISKEEMDEMVNLCVYEQPPFCNAACPLKLDTKAMLAAAAKGDFKKALEIYEKAAVFPLIVSAGCDAPCREKCRLCEIGDAVDIKEIEASIARYGERKKRSSVFRVKKKKTVAIFGSGLFCLFLSGEIEKKAYPLTVFCEETDIDSFLSAELPSLNAADYMLELQRLKEKDIDFVFECNISKSFLDERRAQFDVLCLSEDIARRIYPEAVCDEELMLYKAENAIMGAGHKTLETAFNAKKAALSVDRLAQNLDAGNTRGEEGTVQSKLYTDISVAKELVRTKKTGDVYTKDEAVQEAKRCIQCYCDECFKACAYLRHYKKHPSLLSREIYNNTQIIMGDHPLNKPMNACSLCGQCAVVCPNGFDMARVCHSARENMVSTDKMPLAPHEFALMDMLFSNNEAFLSMPQAGYDKCKYVFFPGCQANAIAPDTVAAAYLDLCNRLDGGVALMLGCCGAICDWAGRYEMYGSTKEFIDIELSKLGDPIVIVGCPSCKKELSSHDGIKIRGIWDVLNEIGLPEGTQQMDRPAALHDSCGARGDAQTQKAIRSIAESLGCRLEDTVLSGDRSPCCGYGGLTSYANRELAKEMTESCLERSELPYISYCMACRDRFAREGRESKHILELVYGTDAGAPPDISEKRYNRLKLKNTLLSELWGQEVEKVELDYKLEFTEEALKMMDERMILKGDVIAVTDYVRQTGEAIFDSEKDMFVARRRVGNVTFWVGYHEIEGGFEICRAYSHRMNVVQRQG